MSNHIIVFSEKKSNRLSYVLREVLVRRLNWTFQIETDVEAFSTAQGARLNYSNQSISGVPSIKPSGLLTEKSVREIEFDHTINEDFHLFINDDSFLGFDLFSDVFFHLSLYQEYWPHKTDEHGRNTFSESVLVASDAYQVPWVDKHTRDFAFRLISFYEELTAESSTAKSVVTVDVDQLLAIRSKGLVRSFFAAIRDLLKGKLTERVRVLRGKKADPLDVYDSLTDIAKSSDSDLLFFFQVGQNSRYDINNPPHLHGVKQRISEIAFQNQIGLHPSYYSSDSVDLLESEVVRLESIVSDSVRKSRQHYLRFKLPVTFRQLAELGIKDDYSMAFHNRNGFRAATCRPFKFFDIQKDETVDIDLHSAAWMDMIAFTGRAKLEDIHDEFNRLRDEVVEFGGEFITIWHPEQIVGLHGDSRFEDFKSVMLRDELAA